MKFEIETFEEAKACAKSLMRYLSEHCPSCGESHTIACMGGGRCVHCGRMLCAVHTLAEAVVEVSPERWR